MDTKTGIKNIGVALIALCACVALTTASAATKKSHIEVGFLYVSPIGNGGWNYQHDLGRKYMQKQLGNRVKTIYAENVPVTNAARVIRQMAASGADLIFTPSFGYMNPTIKVARQFPDVVFMNATGYKTAHNVGTYMSRTYEGRYLSGMLAGMMTKSNKLGFVGGHPIPQLIRAIDAFTLGARAVNSDATVTVIWLNAWYDPSKAREAANTLMDQGIDVMTNYTDSAAVVQAAAERHVYVIGCHSDYSKLAGKYQLTSVMEHWGPYYTKVAQQVLNGTWKSGSVWYGFKHDMVKLAKFSPLVPAKVKQRVLKAKQQIVAGTLHPFAGPIVAKSGKVTVPKGHDMSDADLLELNYYVKGVASKLPTN